MDSKQAAALVAKRFAGKHKGEGVQRYRAQKKMAYHLLPEEEGMRDEAKDDKEDDDVVEEEDAFAPARKRKKVEAQVIQRKRRDNSSSSSFVVAFPRKPKDVADLKKMMFGKQEWHYIGDWGDCTETDTPTQQIAERVFAKIKRKATKKEMIESLEDGWFDPYFHLPGHSPIRCCYSELRKSIYLL